MSIAGLFALAALLFESASADHAYVPGHVIVKYADSTVNTATEVGMTQTYRASGGMVVRMRPAPLPTPFTSPR